MWATMATANRFPSFTTPPPTAHRNHAFTVSVKYQRRPNNKNTFHYHEDDDVEATYSTDKAEIEEALTDSSFSFHSGGGLSDNQPQGISGSDILRALQRATVHKQKKKKLRRISSDAKQKPDPSTTANTSSSSSVESGVKPLRIRRDWSTRLDQLEKRLQELLQI